MAPFDCALRSTVILLTHRRLMGWLSVLSASNRVKKKTPSHPLLTIKIPLLPRRGHVKTKSWHPARSHSQGIKYSTPCLVQTQKLPFAVWLRYNVNTSAAVFLVVFMSTCPFSKEHLVQTQFEPRKRSFPYIFLTLYKSEDWGFAKYQSIDVFFDITCINNKISAVSKVPKQNNRFTNRFSTDIVLPVVSSIVFLYSYYII